jgi:hypothetical protein
VNDSLNKDPEGLAKRFIDTYLDSTDEYNQNKALVLKTGFGLQDQ